jgi:glycosyltransferase involved in cell wall biosynthesis
MTNKFNVIYQGSVLNRSGYGCWADEIATALIKYPLFNTIILQTGWGSCQARQVQGPNDDLIKSHIVNGKKQLAQPHIYIAHSLPHLANPQGSIFNINISAGLETDQLPDDWVDGLIINPNNNQATNIKSGVNHWDLNIVLSNFTKQTYLNSKIKPTKPIEVIPWGMDISIFKKDETSNANVEQLLSNITEDEAFLFIGQETNPNLFMDRKNIDNLIKDFSEAFKGKDKKPALILKTSGCNFSTYDRNTTIERIRAVKDMTLDNDVAIFLIHGELTDEELNALYNHKKVIAFITETRGEGAGGSIAQVSLVGKPIIAPNHSGYLDFIDNRSILIKGDLTEIPIEAQSKWFKKGFKWFEVNHEAMKTAMNDFFYNDRTVHIRNAESLAKENKTRLSLDTMQRNLYKILDKYLKH